MWMSIHKHAVKTETRLAPKDSNSNILAHVRVFLNKVTL